MIVVKAYDSWTASGLDGVNVSIYESGKLLHTVSTNKDGVAYIPDAYSYYDKIVFTRAEYETLSVLRSRFNGNAFLAPANKTLGEVVVTAKKSKPLTIVNPYDKAGQQSVPATKKKVPVWVPVVGGGIIIAAAVYYLTK